MKKFLAIGLIALAMGACHKGMKNSCKGIPNQVLSAFNHKYPEATGIEWDESGGIFEVDFTDGDTEKEATYRPDGTLIEVNERM